jgi:hypothetical protein
MAKNENGSVTYSDFGLRNNFEVHYVKTKLNAGDRVPFIIKVYRPFESEFWILDNSVVPSLSSIRTRRGDNEITLEIVGNTIPAWKEKGETHYFKPFSFFIDRSIIVVSVLDPEDDTYKQLNIGYVESNSLVLEPGLINFTLELPGIERLFREHTVFIDSMSSETKNKKGQDNKKKLQEPGTFASTDFLADYTKIEKEFKTMYRAIGNIWDEFIVKTIRVNNVRGRDFSFGGVPLISEFKNGAISQENAFIELEQQYKEGYTENFTHVFAQMTQMQFGKSMKFWDMIEEFVVEPFYETFCDPLEGKSLLDNGVYRYNVIGGIAKMIIRKTPFDELFDDDGLWKFLKGKYYEIKSSDIYRLTISRDTGNAYSGINVGLVGSETVTNNTVKPKWNHVLRAIYGPKMLNLKLPGITFSGKNSTIKSKLEPLQERMEKIFVNHQSLKHLTGTFSMPFRLLRVGNPFLDPNARLDEIMVKDGKGQVTEKFLKLERNPKYKDVPFHGYISAVEDRFSVDPLDMSTTVQFQWTEDFIKPYAD